MGLGLLLNDLNRRQPNLTQPTQRQRHGRKAFHVLLWLGWAVGGWVSNSPPPPPRRAETFLGPLGFPHDLRGGGGPLHSLPLPPTAVFLARERHPGLWGAFRSVAGLVNGPPGTPRPVEARRARRHGPRDEGEQERL